MLSIAAILAITVVATKYYDYNRAGEELSKWAPNIGSKPLKTHQKGGHEFTPIGVLKSRFALEHDAGHTAGNSTIAYLKDYFVSSKPKPKQEQKSIFVDEFRYFPKTIQKCSPFFLGKSAMEKTRLHWSPVDMTKALLVIGPPGSGKTEFFFNLLFQNWHNRALIRDAKGNDFSPVVVDGKRGFTLSLYNGSSAIWDIFKEKNFLLLLPTVTANLMTGAVGESKDQFFTSSAAARITKMFEAAYLKGNTSTERWKALGLEIQAYEDLAQSPKSRENKDVYNNYLLVAELLKFWMHRIGNAKHTFTLSDFFKSNWELVMNGSEGTMKSYYTALTSAIVDEQLRMEDTTTDLTLYLLDEYLTMSFEEETRRKLHTMIRSKGGCVVMGLQFLPGDDVAKQQIIDSSRYAAIFFNLTDKNTSEHVKAFYGEIKYKEVEKSISKNQYNYTTGMSSSEQERSSTFLSEEELQKKPPYHHLTILNTGECYLGYTPQISMKKIYDPLNDPFDLKTFKTFLHTGQEQ